MNRGEGFSLYSFLTGDADVGKAWSKATGEGRPWTTFLEGGREPRTQAKLIPKPLLMTVHATCQGLGPGPKAWPGVGTGSAGLT